MIAETGFVIDNKDKDLGNGRHVTQKVLVQPTRKEVMKALSLIHI